MSKGFPWGLRAAFGSIGAIEVAGPRWAAFPGSFVEVDPSGPYQTGAFVVVPY